MSAVEGLAVEDRQRRGRAQAAVTRATSARLVYVVALAYTAVFAAAAALDYLLYLEPRFDLGNMAQVVWSTAHGDILRMTTANGTEMVRLGAHFDPFLALLVPLWWIWASPLVLLVAQAAAVASGALPVYWLARKHLQSERAGVLFAIAYLLYPATQFNAFTPIGIHAVSFAIPLILYAVWFLDEDRLILFGLFGLLAATTKEEVAAAAGGLGLWYAFGRGRWIAGGVIFAVGLTISAVVLLVVIPHFSPDGVQPFAGRYRSVGGTPAGMAHVALHDPVAFVRDVVTWHKALYLVLVLAPFAGLWLLEPWLLAGAVPDLAINLFSSKPEQTTIFYHYTAGIVPFVVAASVLGASRVRRRGRALASMGVLITCSAILSPLLFAGYAWHGTSAREIAQTRHAIGLIPPGAPVSVAQSLGGYVSARRSVSVFPSIAKAQWVLLGPPAAGYDRPAAFRRARVRLEANPHWRRVYSAGDVAVYERRPS